MRVAENRPADGPWRSGPGLQAGAAMIDCPSHQGIHTDRGVGSNDPLGDTDDLTAPWADDETADASIRNEDIGPSAEHRDRYLTLGGEAKRSHDFLARPGLDEPVSR